MGHMGAPDESVCSQSVSQVFVGVRICARLLSEGARFHVVVVVVAVVVIVVVVVVVVDLLSLAFSMGAVDELGWIARGTQWSVLRIAFAHAYLRPCTQIGVHCLILYTRYVCLQSVQT